MVAETADTPDIVERLRALGWSVAVHNDYRLNGEAHTFWLFTHPNGRWVKGEGKTDAEALAVALRAAQSPQARDEGGAVEGWVMVPREPGTCELDDSGWLLEFVRALHVYIPEAMQPVSWSDFTDGQRARLKTAYRAMLAAAPSLPTDAINTAEGKPPEPAVETEETASSRANAEGEAGAAVASPPQAPQDVAGLAAEARDWAKYFRHEPSVVVNVHDARFSELLDRLAAALTPRELTDEEAERGWRAYEAKRVELGYINYPKEAARAAYRAIAGGSAR